MKLDRYLDTNKNGHSGGQGHLAYTKSAICGSNQKYCYFMLNFRCFFIIFIHIYALIYIHKDIYSSFTRF